MHPVTNLIIHINIFNPEILKEKISTLLNISLEQYSIYGISIMLVIIGFALFYRRTK